MKLSTNNQKAGLKSLSAMQTRDWRTFNSKLNSFADSVGFASGDKFSDYEITSDLFFGAGFSSDESAALLFLVGEVRDLDAIDSWLNLNRRAVSLL